MPLTHKTLLTAIILLLCAAGATAQEVQVPLDREGAVGEIDRELARRLGLFLDEYPDLEVVRLYQADTGGFVLEIAFVRDGRRARQRVPMTAAEVDALRSRVSEAISRQAPEVTLDQEGRFLLLGTTTFMGLGFYGWAVPVILDMDSPRAVLSTYMFTAGASFVLPYLYTRDRPVTYGMANAGFWGATRGASHGALLSEALDPEGDGRLAAALGLGASLAEGLLGYNWARATDMSAGRAHTIGNFGDFGSALGATSMMVIQPGGDRAVPATVLAGSLAGIGVGAGLADRFPYSWGDAEVQRAGFVLGAANAGVVFDWVADDPSDDQVRLLGALFAGGGLAGAYATHRAMEGLDFSVSQGFLIDLGTVAGGLLGSGLAFLISSEEVDDPTLFFTLAALGADAGFLATFAGLADDARDRARTREERGHGSLEVDFNPAALLALEHLPESTVEHDFAVPLVSIRYRF
jgi:hypothetical protein